MKLLDTYKQIVKEDKGCPAATQDLDLNLKNRNKAFKEYNYGPADPRLDLKQDVDISAIKYDKNRLYTEAQEEDIFLTEEELKEKGNYSYWKKLSDVYNQESINQSLQMRCGNCAAFVITSEMKGCIEKGISDVESALTEKAGELGYCQFLKFKCAAARTCESWVGGGPIKDEEVEERKLTKKEKKGLTKLEKDIPMKSFKKQYGKDAEDIYYGTLTNLAKKKY